MSHNISQISSQVIQMLHHLQPQLQIEVPLTTTSIITKMANETDLVKHLAPIYPKQLVLAKHLLPATILNKACSVGLFFGPLE